MRLTRRSFVQSAAAAAITAPLSRSLASPPNTPSREPLRELPYGAVQLTDGPFADQYYAIHQHYVGLSNDNLLKVYRQRAGLPAPGADMGGWYDLNGFVPGHSLGQYISGLARIGATTSDAACVNKVHDLVDGFAATLGPKNESILRPATNLWVAYTLDKHFVGMIDASRLSGNTDARAVLNRIMDGAIAQKLLPEQGRDRIGKKDPPYDETFVMPENLFAAADLTGNPAFLDYAHRYLLDKELFAPLARNEDPLPGQHAYSHAIALSSAAAAYLHGGDASYTATLENAFTKLTTEQQFSSGGWGPNETFITPHKGELFTALSTTVDHFETPCGSYAATKLARYLTRITAAPPDTRHGDNLERVLYNTILAVRFPDDDGDYPYYSTYSANGEKVFYQKKWPCCSGTLVQTVADYPLNLYFTTGDGLYVSQFVSSRARFDIHGTHIELEQLSLLPAGDRATLTLHPDRPVSFAFKLRLPAWAEGASVAVNGKPVPAVVRGTFTTIHRTWSPGDRVELHLPQQFRTEAIDDKNPHCVALMRGPVQYVALEPPSKEKPKPSGASDLRVLPSGLRQLAPQHFVENYSGRDVHFVPLYTVRDQRYSAYFSIA